MSGNDRKKRVDRMRGHRSGRGSPSARLFERLVEEALDAIPEPFRSHLESVAIVIEDEPSRELLRSTGVPAGETLLGLYDGTPLTERGDWYNLVPPDRIILFRKPLESMSSSVDELRAEVRTTVIHEIAHFYGIDDEELRRMGLD